MQSHDTPWSTIPELIDDAARRFPDDEAVVDDDERWTFGELADRVHEAARALIATGIAPGDRVGIWAPNIREWVVAALAAYDAGACLVPVNTRFKGREARDVLSRSGRPDPLHGDRLSRRRLRGRGAGRRRGRVAGGDRGAARHGARRYGRVRPTSSHAAPPSTTPPVPSAPPACAATTSATSSSRRARPAHRRA